MMAAVIEQRIFYLVCPAKITAALVASAGEEAVIISRECDAGVR